MNLQADASLADVATPNAPASVNMSGHVVGANLDHALSLNKLVAKAQQISGVHEKSYKEWVDVERYIFRFDPTIWALLAPNYAAHTVTTVQNWISNDQTPAGSRPTNLHLPS